jgi:maltose/maltodextrin transport system permease protein
MGLFVLFPLICTIAIAFTNYSSTNQLTFERAQSVLMQRQFQTGKTFTFGLYPAENQRWRLQLTHPDSDQKLISEPFSFDASAPQTLKLTEESAEPAGERATLRVITQNRQALSQLVALLPDGGELRMSSLRQFSGTTAAVQAGWTRTAIELTDATNRHTQYRPNPDTGFYQAVNAEGELAA